MVLPTERSAPSPVPLSTLLPLLQESLAQEGRLVLPLNGTSMQPTLPQQCRVEIVPLPGSVQDLRLGSLIVFGMEDALISHRLVARQSVQGQLLWIAQGDGRRAPDIPMRPDKVLGRVASALDGDSQIIWPGPWEEGWAMLWIARYHGLRAVRPVVRWVRTLLRRLGNSHL